jgi:hypothetical protein
MSGLFKKNKNYVVLPDEYDDDDNDEQEAIIIDTRSNNNGHNVINNTLSTSSSQKGDIELNSIKKNNLSSTSADFIEQQQQQPEEKKYVIHKVGFKNQKFIPIKHHQPPQNQSTQIEDFKPLTTGPAYKDVGKSVSMGTKVPRWRKIKIFLFSYAVLLFFVASVLGFTLLRNYISEGFKDGYDTFVQNGIFYVSVVGASFVSGVLFMGFVLFGGGNKYGGIKFILYGITVVLLIGTGAIYPSVTDEVYIYVFNGGTLILVVVVWIVITIIDKVISIQIEDRTRDKMELIMIILFYFFTGVTILLILSSGSVSDFIKHSVMPWVMAAILAVLFCLAVWKLFDDKNIKQFDSTFFYLHLFKLTIISISFILTLMTGVSIPVLSGSFSLDWTGIVVAKKHKQTFVKLDNKYISESYRNIYPKYN